MTVGPERLIRAILTIACFVPLALVLIMPVLINIIAFHIFLEPGGIAPGAVLMALESEKFAPIARVPYFKGVVVSARHEPRAVG